MAVTIRRSRPTADQMLELQAELEAARGQLEVAKARQEALICSLRDLIAMFDQKAHAWPKEQVALRKASALVAECEQPKERSNGH